MFERQGLAASRENQKPQSTCALSVEQSWRFVLLTILGLSGCAAPVTCYQELTPRDVLRSTCPEIHIEYGKPNRFLDATQSVAEVPARILRKGRADAGRDCPEETEAWLRDYLQQNSISDVPVLVHKYDPVGEWRRLRENQRISPVWKYTVGTCTVVGYSLIPGRVTGFDDYNPFTNSLSVNSGNLSDALNEAAYAKDIHHRSYPGLYAVANTLPGISLWKTTRAVNDAVAYAQARDSWDLESEIYRKQYPQLAIETVVPAGFFVSPVANIALAMGGSAVGYAVGRTVERQRIQDRNKSAGDEPAAEETGKPDPDQQKSPVNSAADIEHADDGQAEDR